MPARPLLPGKTTVYLDTSVLVDILNASTVGNTQSDTAYRPLFKWVESIATEANLVLSVAHLLEISQWPDKDGARALLSWLDELQTVWLHSLENLQAQETEHWLRRSLGESPDQVEPFAPSRLAAMPQLLVSESPDALRFIKLQDMLPVYKQLDFTNYREHTLQVAKLGHDDRNKALAKLSPQELESELAYRQRVSLRTLAGETQQRCDLPTRGLDGRHVQDLFEELYFREPHSLPSWRVTHMFNAAWVSLNAVRTPGSQRFKRSKSTFGDWLHAATGGAYCQVFTCDKDTESCLGDVRSQMGLRRQMSPGGNVQRFVAELLSIAPSA
jgi:hypothetical protein